jgi:hypothetical protein
MKRIMKSRDASGLRTSAVTMGAHSSATGVGFRDPAEHNAETLATAHGALHHRKR